MKHLLRITGLIGLALICLPTCLAQEPPAKEKPATANSQAAEVQDAKATIYFYRLKQFGGHALEPTVYCDEKPLARMDNGRYFGVKIDPGKHACNMGDKQ